MTKPTPTMNNGYDRELTNEDKRLFWNVGSDRAPMLLTMRNFDVVDMVTAGEHAKALHLTGQTWRDSVRADCESLT